MGERENFVLVYISTNGKWKKLWQLTHVSWKLMKMWNLEDKLKCQRGFLVYMNYACCQKSHVLSKVWKKNSWNIRNLYFWNKDILFLVLRMEPALSSTILKIPALFSASVCLKDSKNVLHEILANRAMLTNTAHSAQFWRISQNWLCYLAWS